MFVLCIILFFIPCLVSAEIYDWTDANGTKHFSDKSQQNSQLLSSKLSYRFHWLKKVYDGDTILLANGKKVRLSGINAQEVKYRNKPAQVGGEEAKRWLIEKLANKKIRLLMDLEKQDKYGRLLAHIFTEDKEHINLELVKKGLASVSIYPPNLKFSEDLLKAQQQAERNKLGIWKYEKYKPKQLNQINQTNYKGWQRIIGQIKSVHHTERYSYLQLSDIFSLKIARKSIKLFPKLENYIGKKVEVRGWINTYKNRYIMFIRHPSCLILETVIA